MAGTCGSASASRHVLRDGRTVVLRAGGPQDSDAVARLYMELSPESYRSRFHGGCGTPALVASLARLGPPTGAECVIAVVPGQPERLVGEARYVPMDDCVAEFGIAVLDEYQGTGLGRLLLDALVRHARARGLVRLRAVVSLANTAMLRLIEPFGWVLAEPTDLAVAYLEISVVGGMPGWPARRAGQRILVERRGWFDTAQVVALRQAGHEVRQCAGPRRSAGRPCPLVASGRCLLAEEADLIAAMLPGDDDECAEVLAAHRRRWAGRLVGEDAGQAASAQVGQAAPAQAGSTAKQA